MPRLGDDGHVLVLCLLCWPLRPPDPAWACWGGGSASGGDHGIAAATRSGTSTPGGGRGTGGQPAGSPAREGGGGGGKGTPDSPRQTAVPRPWASDRCKPGRQGSPPPASPSGVGGSQGPAQQAEHQHMDIIAPLPAPGRRRWGGGGWELLPCPPGFSKKESNRNRPLGGMLHWRTRRPPVQPSTTSQGPGGSLREKKKVFLNGSFAKRPRVAHMFNHGWWRLAVGGWQFVVPWGGP